MWVPVSPHSPLGTSILPLTKNSSGHDSHSIRPSNLVFIQYLFALAVVEGCQALDPAKEWATKVKLKWPNDIYGEFPAEETWKRVELKKLGGILVNTSFGGNVADVIIGRCHIHRWLPIGT
jgi:biotin--protein ligase